MDRALQHAENTVIEGSKVRVDVIRNIKLFSPEANIFFWNVDPNNSPEEMKSVFQSFGKVASFKLVTNRSKSVGHGYVQFEKKENADECLASKEKLQAIGQNIELSKFVPKDKRQTTKNTLYLRNLPESRSNEEIARQIQVLPLHSP